MTIARNAVRSITRGWLATTSPRIRQRIPASQSFWICTRAYSRTGRDVLAAYRKPIATPAKPVDLDAPDVDGPHADEVFRTVSTSPAGSSMQEIPPPSELQGGSRLETPIPAMKAPEDVLPSKRKLEPSQSRKEIIVQGVPIPPKPIAPGEEECCMSGCVHCVYTIYADDLELYTDSLSSARDALKQSQVKLSDWPEEVRDLESKDGKGMGEQVVQDKEQAKAQQGMDPSMAAFLAFENSLKKKQAPTSSAAS